MLPLHSQFETINYRPTRRFIRTSQLRGSLNKDETTRPIIFVIFYSMYGHEVKLATSIQDGIESSGCQCRMFQIAETLSDETLAKIDVPLKPHNISIIRPNQLPEADGLLFGIPARIGSLPAQVKALFDACDDYRYSNALNGKPAGLFFSTRTSTDGQETAALSCLPVFAHLGMIFVPIGHKDKSLLNTNEVHGASPYGAGTLCGPKGDKKPTDLELTIAKTQGYEFGNIVKKLMLKSKDA